jgi:galactokinase
MGAGFGGSILALIERGAEGRLAAAVQRPVIVCSTADGAFVAPSRGESAA